LVMRRVTRRDSRRISVAIWSRGGGGPRGGEARWDPRRGIARRHLPAPALQQLLVLGLSQEFTIRQNVSVAVAQRLSDRSSPIIKCVSVGGYKFLSQWRRPGAAPSRLPAPPIPPPRCHSLRRPPPTPPRPPRGVPRIRPHGVGPSDHPPPTQNGGRGGGSNHPP